MNRALMLMLMLPFGCDGGGPATQIVVIIDSDLDTPAELDGVRVEATGMQVATGSLVGGDAVPLPRSVSLVQSGDSLGPLEVRVVGTLGGADVVERSVTTSFIAERSLVLEVFLQRSCRGVSCAAGATCVGGACANDSVDPESLEDFDGGVGRLDGGTCMPVDEVCNGNDDDCDGNVDEGFDLVTDPLNCGFCRNACSRPNASVGCADSVCVVTDCESGFGNCDADDMNGCEDDLTSATHCGMCGNTCTFPNGVAGCEAGSCVLTGCEAGFEDCNADPSDGCEVATNTLTDCGGCGVACSVANGTATCATGACAVDTCDALFGDCNTDASDGCEQTLDTLAHCAACDTACSVSNGTPTCATGTCAIETCDALFDDCNADDTDGCEVSLNTLTDCGSCGTPCSVADGTATCATGTCAVDTCDMWFGDCNSDASDGCEQDVRRDESHCGVCNMMCVAPTDRCTNGVCQ